MNERKFKIAQRLSDSHVEAETRLIKIVIILSPLEENDDEPIKLLEVNEDTVPSGIMPIEFAPSGWVQFSTVIVEVTPEEYEDILDGRLQLPEGWTLGETIYPTEGENVQRG